LTFCLIDIIEANIKVNAIVGSATTISETEPEVFKDAQQFTMTAPK
jgi:hypothetical protein